MKAGYRSALIVIVFFIIAAVLTWMYVFRESKTSVASKKPDFVVESAELLKAFETNEEDANKLYLGKIVLVTGLVASVSEDSSGITVYLQEPDAVSGIICSFEKSMMDTTRVDQGKKVRIKGICTGYLMDVVINRCSLEDESGF